MGGGGAQRQEQRGGSLRRDRLASVDTPADQVQRRKKKKRMKLQRQSTLIRNEVESLPSFWPVCTILISLAQVNQYGDLIVSGESWLCLNWCLCRLG